MSDTVKYEIEIPAEVHEKLIKLQEQTGLTTTELLIGSSELIYKSPTQGVMKRIARLISARRFEAIMANFPAKTRGKKVNGNE